MRYKSNLVHVRLREETHRRLRVFCAQNNQTMQSFIEQALELNLSQADRENNINNEITQNFPKIDIPAQGLYLDLDGLDNEDIETLTNLSNFDWTFREANTREYTHGIHPYPAKFIPQIPRALVNALHSKDNSAVLDPFCGSGTTLLEATLQGIPAIGVDVNPLAVLLSRVKTTPINYSLKDVIAEIVASARARLHNEERVDIPDIPRLDHWFKHEITRAVAILKEEIQNTRVGQESIEALLVALSGILVRVSNQESDVRYASIEKHVLPDEVITLFEMNALNLSQKLTSTFNMPLFPEISPAKAIVFHRDTRALHHDLPPWKVGLIVTSPPYPNAYEYWLYHKYRMYWLGMDPIAARTHEIGARPYYSKKNGLTAEDFADDMQKCFLAFSKLLPIGRYACFIIGNSTIRGERVDNSSLLIKVAQNNGFRLRARIPREIPSTRKSFNPIIGSIRKESLLIFQRQ